VKSIVSAETLAAPSPATGRIDLFQHGRRWLYALNLRWGNAGVSWPPSPDCPGADTREEAIKIAAQDVLRRVDGADMRLAAWATELVAPKQLSLFTFAFQQVQREEAGSDG
jgi:hypothetical protein